MQDLDVNQRVSLYLVHANSIRGVTAGHQKLIKYACGNTQLFDLIYDPLEMVSFSMEDTSTKLLAQMRQKLVRFLRECNDEYHLTGKVL